MENTNMIRKFKIIVSCLIIAFIFATVMAVVSFVQIGNVRRANANYERQIEQLKNTQAELEEQIEDLQSEKNS